MSTTAAAADDVERALLRRRRNPAEIRRRNDDEYATTTRKDPKIGHTENLNKTAVEKKLPNFFLTGKLLEDTNKLNGSILLYAPPPSNGMSLPTRFWALFPFKTGEQGENQKTLKVIYLHRSSWHMIGKDAKIARVHTAHPSCSKQHAVIQFLKIDTPHSSTDNIRADPGIVPHIIDLESTNGTFLNFNRIEPRRFYELKERDVLKFGYSSREYVVMINRAGERPEDDANDEDLPINVDDLISD